MKFIAYFAGIFALIIHIRMSHSTLINNRGASLLAISYQLLEITSKIELIINAVVNIIPYFLYA